LAHKVLKDRQALQDFRDHREQTAPLAPRGQQDPKARKGFPVLRALKGQQVRRVLQALVFLARRDLKAHRDLRVLGGLLLAPISTTPMRVM
jgi:hypothetical protein